MQELLILMVVVWTAGRLLHPLGVPTVFGELLGGILIGPSVLNLVNSDAETIQVLGELGIFFLMLHTGLKTDHRELLRASTVSVFVAIGGVLISFVSGIGLGMVFGLNTTQALFIGVGISASAIALAASLFKHAGLEKSRAFTITLGAAVVGDVIVLILFSLVMTYAADGKFYLADLLFTLFKISLFFAAVLWFGLKSAPKLHRYLARGHKAFTLTLIVGLLFGFLAESMGLHSIIGAFLAGLFMQQELMDPALYEKIEDRFYGLAYSFFGPIFFASLAFHIDFGALLHAPTFLAACILVAFVGKLIGCGGVAVLARIPPMESLLIGLSMNIRGTVELIMVAIALERGVIDATIFSVLVCMAFGTTILSMMFMTPLIKRMRQEIT